MIQALYPLWFTIFKALARAGKLKIEQNNITSYREYHVKVFNTGKLEIPGIQNEKVFELILDEVIQTLQPHIKEKLYFKKGSW